MKYISKNERGAWNLVEYERYLEGEGALLAQHIAGDQLLTISRFGLDGRGTFHDARFETFSVSSIVASPSPDRSQDASQALLVLKGPYFDRLFRVTYLGVSEVVFRAPSAKDDLLVHEIRSEHGVVIHELLFDDNKKIEVRCESLQFKETMLP